jgi:hypothetical protein
MFVQALEAVPNQDVNGPGFPAGSGWVGLFPNSMLGLDIAWVGLGLCKLGVGLPTYD